MSTDCIFCRIVAGEVPCTKVHETDRILAFMDIGPIVKGHTLVIPKEHFENITETPAELLGDMAAEIKRVAAAQLSGLSADGINVTQANGAVAGQVVPHIHFHVIPRFEDDGHQWNWNPRSYRDNDEMAGYAERIARALE